MLPALSRRLPLLFALLKFFSGLALVGYGLYELHRDEYFYLDYGRHLAWGYLEVPPSISAAQLCRPSRPCKAGRR